MNSLLCGQYKDKLEKKCLTCAENNINIKSGNINSIIIPNGTLVETSYIVSSLNVNRKNSSILEFTCNITNTNFIGTISFQVFKLFNNNSTLIPIGPPWILSRPSANASSDILSFFSYDEDICINKSCTYILKATIIDSLFRNLSITNIGSGGNLTLVGPSTIIINGNITITFVGNIDFPNVSGNINILGLFGNTSQSGSTVTVDNIEGGSFVFTKMAGYETIFILNDPLTLIITPVNGEIREERLTSGTSIITNATLAAISY